MNPPLPELSFTAPDNPKEREKWINDWCDWVTGLSHTQCAFLHRFAPSGHPVFDNRYPIYGKFKARFDYLGGMTPQISKAIGLGS